MKKLSLRKENLAELSGDQLRDVAGAVPNAGTDSCTVNVSANTCVCTFDGGGFAPPRIPCNVQVSAGSCVC